MESVRPLLTVMLLLAFGTSAFAGNPAGKPCTKSEEVEAEQETDTLKDWDHVYRSYKKFAQCDDGAVGEGYSEAVSKLLADDWKDLLRLIALTNADKRFQQFVVKHIDETVSAEVLSKIENNAQSNCPARRRQFCHLIASAANGKFETSERVAVPAQVAEILIPILDELQKYRTAGGHDESLLDELFTRLAKSKGILPTKHLS